MNIGLLVCDHVLPELSVHHGDYPKMFGDLLPEMQMTPIYICDGEQPNLADFDAFISTGSKRSVYEEEDWILDLADLMKRIDSSNHTSVQ